MPIPPLNAEGDLPRGVYLASLSDVLAHFGIGTAQRAAVARRLVRVCHLAQSTGHLARFIVFGSFITAKPEPNDVDVFILMEDSFKPSLLTGEPRLLFDHALAQTNLGASVFWIRRLAVIGREQDVIEYWQVKRGGGQRGIVEIIAEAP